MEGLRGSIGVTLYLNPWEPIIRDRDLFGLIHRSAATVVDEIELRCGTEGQVHDPLFPRMGMGFAILDPTAPWTKESDDTLLATIAVGEPDLDPDHWVVNGLAKAVRDRDFATNNGYPVYVARHMLAAGDFVRGFSACVDGTWVGGSAQTEIADRMAAHKLGAEFNLEVERIIRAWEAEHPDHKWLTADGGPGGRYGAILQRRHALLLPRLYAGRQN